ncbi:hypothetical protein VB773_12645 [Haloarculaceae archaeon H-GB2-1]|nr:hypothetical protein [Haloarculaceae archaeon H-GB2-1]
MTRQRRYGRPETILRREPEWVDEDERGGIAPRLGVALADDRRVTDDPGEQLCHECEPEALVPAHLPTERLKRTGPRCECGGITDRLAVVVDDPSLRQGVALFAAFPDLAVGHLAGRHIEDDREIERAVRRYAECDGVRGESALAGARGATTNDPP